LLSDGEPKPWMKPWVSKLIVEEALERRYDILNAISTDEINVLDAEWYQQLRADAEQYDIRHVAKGLESGRNNKPWKLDKVENMTTQELVALYLKETPDRKRDKAAAKGTDVHKLVENIEKGFNVIVPPELQPYVDSFRQFRKDFPIKYTEIESTVYSDTYGYAGQFDFLAEHDGKIIMGDYKTGDKGIKETIALQFAGYAGADFIGREDGTKDPVPHIDEFWGVSITDKGYEVVPVNVTHETWNYFLAIREVAAWINLKKSDVLGRALKAAA
jgi:hypothetical protein